VFLVLCAAAFGFLAIQPHREARATLEAEDRAVAELRSRAARAPHESAEQAAGYEYRWAEGVVLLARPRTAGVRWFATADGDVVLEYDPALFQVGPDGPATEPVVRYLAAEKAGQPLASRPSGWKRLR